MNIGIHLTEENKGFDKIKILISSSNSSPAGVNNVRAYIIKDKIKITQQYSYFISWIKNIIKIDDKP